MDKKCFILLFPEKEYFGMKSYEELKDFFKCINVRYRRKGYSFYVAKYLSSNDEMLPYSYDKSVEADISFLQSSPYFTQDWKYADMGHIASKLKIEDFEQIVIGGFHCHDCVYKLAKAIEKLNPNVLIDTELTEFFWSNKMQAGEDFDYENFDPDAKIWRFVNNDFVLVSSAKSAVEKYQDKVYGISEEAFLALKKRLEKAIDEEEEYYSSKQS